MRPIFLFITLLAVILPTDASPQIKLSRNGVCHALTGPMQSPYYDRVKRYQAFASLEACLNAGGRLPKELQPNSSHRESVPSLSKADAYSRKHFGHGWDDEDGDCQNTRHEILIRRSTVTPVLNENGCRAVHGRWISPFTGNVLSNAQEVDIDHVVPLKWAWDHGARKWTRDKREQFANDPVNLIAVERSLNRQKGASGPTQWLPPKNQCQYVARFVRVLHIYDLPVGSSLKALKLRCSAMN
ncbi:HNH endonuclease family protein [Bermanella marisrubri]|uniref:HNH endonuclease family protein n=1 Tax=Bermanella marisrubri TaxID=207949 RepID=UPI001A9D3FE3|nr:HNH endonuclease family protein [Bermanella marisrubri]